MQKRNAHYGLQWNDVDCSNLAYFLCAYDHNLYRPELEGNYISLNGTIVLLFKLMLFFYRGRKMYMQGLYEGRKM